MKQAHSGTIKSLSFLTVPNDLCNFSSGQKNCEVPKSIILIAESGFFDSYKIFSGFISLKKKIMLKYQDDSLEDS